MTELSSVEFERQTDEVIKMVNDHHDEYVREQERLLNEQNKGFNALRKKILSRITGYNTEKTTKKEVIHFINDNNIALIIKNSEGIVIGVMSLTNGFREKVKAKIELVNNKPIFIIYRGNEVYLNTDIYTNKTIAKFTVGETLEEVKAEIRESRPMFNGSKEIYELRENKQYSVLDNYITDCMVKILENDGLNLSPVDITNLHTQLQVQYREIQRTKMELATAEQITEEHGEMLKTLDNLYLVICTNLINMGLFELPEINEEKITRS